MTPTIAIIFALAIAAWALAWWDIQRRKQAGESELRLINQALAELTESGHELMSADTRLAGRIAELEKNPATMAATKERVTTLERAMAELVKQTKDELESMRARTMTLTNTRYARPGARPNG